MSCTCGHVDDEHTFAFGTYKECCVDNCPCMYFEWDGEAEPE